MINIPSLRPETRYGLPVADHILFNRQYIIGYSYLFRQPKFALEIIDPSTSFIDIDSRLDSFRPDMRIPDEFRVLMEDYKGSGYDRGHLISSADRRSSGVINSETFLLTNMSPQHPDLNRKAWRKLEEKVRELAEMKKVVEVYVCCGPLFDVGGKIKVIGNDTSDTYDSLIPVPHSYFKSVLSEELRGRFKMWNFVMPNKNCTEPLENYQVTAKEIEIRSGLILWDRMRDPAFERLKKRVSKVWFK